MKWIFFTLVSLVLTSCVATHKSPQTARTTQSKVTKNPYSVELYSLKQKPEKPYVVVAEETVSKFNEVGIKRQTANINDSIRKIAAIKGADAVIEIKNNSDSISYAMISYNTAPESVA